MAVVIVKFVALWAVPKFPPEIELTNPGVLEGQLQRLMVGLRGVVQVRLGPRVHNRPDTIRLP